MSAAICPECGKEMLWDVGEEYLLVTVFEGKIGRATWHAHVETPKSKTPLGVVTAYAKGDVCDAVRHYYPNRSLHFHWPKLEPVQLESEYYSA